MSGNVGLNTVDSGLILCLDAANTKSVVSGNTTVYDLSRSSLTGSLVGGVTYSGSSGGNLVLNGSTGYVQFDTNKTYSSTITVDLWFRSIKATRHHLWNIGPGSGTNSLNCDVNDSFALWVYWNGAGGNSVRFTMPSLSDGVIKNLTFVHNGSTNSVYLNGVLLTGGTPTGTQSFTTVSGTTYIGSTGSGAYTQGNIYNFKIYNKALTAEEVSINYNTTKSRFGL